jgi:glycosyltransferase involved in cell wall biosynthesis
VNIAILQHTYNPTTIGWVQGLEARGHHVTVIVSSLREPLGGADHGQVVVVADLPWTQRWGRRIFKGRAKAVVALPRPGELWRAMRAVRPDLVLVKVYSLRNVLASVFALALGARRMGWLEQVPPAGREWRVLRAVGLLPRRWFTALADRPGALSQAHSAGSPHIPYAPVDRGSAVQRDAPGRPLRLLTVASFTNAVKRPGWTLEAAIIAGLVPSGAKLTFCGLGGPGRMDERLLARIAESHADAEVLVNVAHRDMMSVYDAHDVLVLPSSAEQFGMVVPEAMARGMAVVVSDVVGAIGFIDDERTGLVFDADDVTDLARQLARLAADPDLVRRLGAPRRCRRRSARLAGGHRRAHRAARSTLTEAAGSRGPQPAARNSWNAAAPMMTTISATSASEVGLRTTLRRPADAAGRRRRTGPHQRWRAGGPRCRCRPAPGPHRRPAR